MPWVEVNWQMFASWLLLHFAGLLEACWAVGCRSTYGLIRLGPSLLTALGSATSLGCLSWAARENSSGTANAVWCGSGTAGAAFLGIWLWGDPIGPARLYFLPLMLISVVGLKLNAGA